MPFLGLADKLSRLVLTCRKLKGSVLRCAYELSWHSLTDQIVDGIARGLLVFSAGLAQRTFLQYQ